MPELREAWHDQLSNDERAALAVVLAKQVEPGEEVTVAEAVSFAIAHLSEKWSVFPERELKRVSLLRGLGSVTPEEIAAELTRQGVITADLDGRQMATTELLQREEDYIVGQAMGGRGSVTPAGVPEGLTRQLADGKALNDGQWDALTGMLSSENRVALLVGPAGAGKTELLKKDDEGMRLADRPVTWLATTTDAVRVLAKDGFEVNTVARFLLDERLQAGAKNGQAIIDESSMLGHKDAVKLFQLAERLNLKITFVGDPVQHGAVSRGSLLKILTEYGGIKPHRLTEIIRQENPDYRAAAMLLSQGESVKGFDAIDAMGNIEEIADAEERYRAIAKDYRQSLDDKKATLVVSPTHAEAAHITAAIRDELRQAGKLGPEDHAFLRLVPVDSTEAARGLASTYRQGDVLQFHQNAKGFTKGQRLTVTDPAAVPTLHADKFSIYRPEPVLLAAGDKIRMTGNIRTTDGKHLLKNGMSHSVAGFTPKGIRLDNGWVIPNEAGHFRPGFVETSMGSQGRTVQRVILGMAASSIPAMSLEQLYVSATRAKESLKLYTDSKHDIRRAVERSSQKLAALDLRPKPEEPLFRPLEGRQEHMERRRRLSVFDWMKSAWERAMPARPLSQHQERQADGYGR